MAAADPKQAVTRFELCASNWVGSIGIRTHVALAQREAVGDSQGDLWFRRKLLC